MIKVSKNVSWEIVKNTLFPLILFLLALVFYIFYKTNLAPFIPETIRQPIGKYSLTIFVISIAFIAQRIIGAVSFWYRGNIAKRTQTTLDDELIPLARRTLKILVWIIAFLIILPLYGINISALIAALGVSSLAIALAAQDTIANIISGFMIMIDKPFMIGDKIKLPSGEEVTVLEIGVRRSHFLFQDKAIIIVPNTELSKSRIINYTYGQEKIKK